MKFAYAPGQYLLDVDEESPELFREALRKLKDAGAELVEIDLGVDFHELTARTTWPIFFHETLTAIREFLATNGVPVSCEEILVGLGEHVKRGWSRSVVRSSADYVSDETYCTALNANRRELRPRLASIVSVAQTRCSPDDPVCGAACGGPVEVPLRRLTDLFLSRNTHPSNAAGVPGITLPMGLDSEGLPLGLELDVWLPART